MRPKGELIKVLILANDTDIVDVVDDVMIVGGIISVSGMQDWL